MGNKIRKYRDQIKPLRLCRLNIVFNQVPDTSCHVATEGNQKQSWPSRKENENPKRYLNETYTCTGALSGA